MLEAECRAGVQIFLNIKVQEVSRTTEFVVRSQEDEFHAPALVVATGGLSHFRRWEQPVSDTILPASLD